MTDRHAADRCRMVERQLKRRGIADPRVLAAMGRVPREAFVPTDLAEFAYDDNPLPIAEGQTISQPYVVALMAEAARIGEGERVLEVGTGSGYAAAIFAELAAEVVTIERHAALAEGARAALRRLGYPDVEVVHGDGSLGVPERAPYDAVLVAAGAPAPPDSLKRQLAEGGRMVIPVSVDSHQELRVITRRGEEFEEENLGAVRFVPLLGKEGWREHEPDAGPTRETDERRSARPRIIPAEDLPRAIAAAGKPFASPDGAEVTALLDDLGDARVVLLGEATHGTSEFYRARAAITRRLVERHGFNIVAVEADWPDASRIDRHVRHRGRGADVERAFSRFPTWMWRNEEVLAFVEWLRGWNADRPRESRASFHGLDLYGLSASIAAVTDYLDKVDPEAARVARERYGCLTPWQKDPSAYGRAALLEGNRRCETAVLDNLRDLLANRLEYIALDGEAYLEAEGNARLVAAAETYYRAMYYGYAESWNQRDRHMFETLERVLAARGPGSKAVVWAHNSHVGNAAATEMGLVRDEINIGQLARERFGEKAILVGFGTDRGEVAAATDWDGTMEIKAVRPAHAESYEALFRQSGGPRLYLDLAAHRDRPLGEALAKPRLERAIGVIYRPETEMVSHYFEARLPEQFDRYLWFEVTSAVTLLGPETRAGLPDTYPFGL
ncbi:MAG: protein-L-isoaspartate(D-aspartate) O-methyltransferase [Rhizobiales bacterium]|nr:protein-L-isoaspartate(D-aspartate) O-methyltransferase [Hyphomicrobiales bacterium]